MCDEVARPPLWTARDEAIADSLSGPLVSVLEGALRKGESYDQALDAMQAAMINFGVRCWRVRSAMRSVAEVWMRRHRHLDQMPIAKYCTDD